MKKGKLIVFEGTDGSGKATQIAFLRDYLRYQAIEHEILDFPRYDSSFFGAMVGQYLKGDFGSLDQVDPHFSSLPYALDRWQAKPQIEDWLNRGKLVVVNRYATASRGHLVANVKPSRRKAFLQWLRQMEYEVLQVPKEDLVLFLYVPPVIGQQLVLKKDKRKYLGNKKQDLHEANLEHLENAAKVFSQIAQEEGWRTIQCVENDRLLSREVIHQKVLEVLRREKIIK